MAANKDWLSVGGMRRAPGALDAELGGHGQALSATRAPDASPFLSPVPLRPALDASPPGLRRHRIGLPWLDPVEAHKRLASMSPMLMHGAGAHPDARRSILALSPAWQATLEGGRWTLHDEGRKRVLPGQPLDVLRSLCDEMRHDVTEEAFTGGIVGYFGYGFLHELEPTLPSEAADTPDAVLWLCRDAVVLDNVAREAVLWVADLPGEDGAARRAVRVQRAWAEMARSSAATVPRDPAGAGGRAGAVGDAAAAGDGAEQAADGAAQAVEGTAGAAHGAAGAGNGALASMDALPPSAAALWHTSMDEAAFCQGVTALRQRIFDGDLFQANLATRFTTACAKEPHAMLGELAAANPSPFMALIDAGDHKVVSCSPELLFKVEKGIVSARPIAGTRRRGTHADHDDQMERELLTDAKEQAEHTMLVDLVRNDVAQVAVPGTVHVPERMSVERYRHVMHLVSRVEGRLRPGTDFVHWIKALFPGGTITGAPKHRACMRIADAEPVARGPYTGSAGYLSWSHNAQWNILIRTLVLKDGEARVHAGSGIVADSDPGREWKEAGRKARALLEAAGAVRDPIVAPPASRPQEQRDGGAARSAADPSPAPPSRLGQVTRHGSWRPPAARRVPGRRVLIVDNFDSFTHNLADHLAAIGADVSVVRNDSDWVAAWRALAPTHAVLSPGPGRPEDSGATLDLLARQAWAAGVLDVAGLADQARLAGAPKLEDGWASVPVLGVCLGHQAMGLATGARIVRLPPVHGRPDDVHHDGASLLAGLPSPFSATRYHSLAVEGLRQAWRATAWLGDGTLMAMEHRRLPWWGLQFHPESLCTDTGVEILARFLELEHGRHRVR